MSIYDIEEYITGIEVFKRSLFHMSRIHNYPKDNPTIIRKEKRDLKYIINMLYFIGLGINGCTG